MLCLLVDLDVIHHSTYNQRNPQLCDADVIM